MPVHAKLLYGITLTFVSASSVFPTALVAIVCQGLRLQFNDISDEIARQISEDGDFLGDLEILRLRHNELCNLVSLIDKAFSPYFLNIFVLNVVICCVLMHNMILGVYQDGYRLALAVFGVVTVLVQILVITISAARVNSAVSTTLILPMLGLLSSKTQRCKDY